MDEAKTLQAQELAEVGGVNTPLNSLLPYSPQTPNTPKPQEREQVNEKDLPELALLTDKQAAFVLAMIENGFKQTRAGETVYGKGHGGQLASKMMLRNKKVRSVVEKARALCLQRSIEKGIWNFEQSLRFAKDMLMSLQKLYDSVDTRITQVFSATTTVEIERGKERQRLSTSMNFWKENLDKMHGLLKEKQEIETRLEIVELKNAPASDLLELARRIKDIKEQRVGTAIKN